MASMIGKWWVAGWDVSGLACNRLSGLGENAGVDRKLLLRPVPCSMGGKVVGQTDSSPLLSGKKKRPSNTNLRQTIPSPSRMVKHQTCFAPSIAASTLL